MIGLLLKHKRLLLLLWVGWLSFSSLSLHAEGDNTLVESQYSSKLLLSSFLSTYQPIIRLHGSYDSVEANIPVSTRVQVKSMKLHMVFSNSLSLAKARSQLRFRFNGRIIGQLKLDPEYPEGEIDLLVPVELIHKGDNVIKFESSLYTPLNTSASNTSELWAEIDADNSTITMATESIAIDLKFSALKDLVHGSSWKGHYPLSVLLGSDKPSDLMLNAALKTVQGMALLTNHIPVQVYAGSAKVVEASKVVGDLTQLHMPLPHADSLLIGTYQQLQGVVGEEVIDESLADEQLLLTRSPSDESHFVLIVTGVNEEHVLAAARHFSLMNLSLANHNQVSFDRSNIAAEEQVIKTHSNVLQPMMRYNFEQLGVGDRVLKKSKDYIDLPLRMPADLFAIKDDNVKVSLHFSYEPGMTVGSRMNILLNGVFQYSIPTDDPNGLIVGEYRVKLPLRSFKTGSNVLRLESIIVPSDISLKNESLYKNIQISLYGDSIVRIPQMSQYARLPDLSMLKDTGYPYVEHTPSQIVLAALNDNNISSALTLGAKLAQLQQHPTPELTLASKQMAAKGSVFVLGALADIKAEILQASPFTLKKNGVLFPVVDAYSNDGVPHNTMSTAVGFEHVIDAFSRRVNQSKDLQYLDMTDHTLLSQFERPNTEGDSIMMLTSGDDKQLLQAVYQMVNKQLWGALAGDTFVWGTHDALNKPRGYALELSDEYHTGSLSFFGKVAYYAITSPIYLMLALLFLVTILTWLTRKLIVLHHESRLL